MTTAAMIMLVGNKKQHARAHGAWSIILRHDCHHTQRQPLICGGCRRRQ
eukprot:CAMPEP_0168796598 /NCGR_PEP_ID=MMETSP0725-20121227/16846_1 /TAXON_ID=265536 /ORGANISM="Amphiprora sp., Strain CCMP467" /LENGTH=48 /DNA_ID= /DNA_START= /DNA_END= /DNA_ORIENTATION=